MLKTPIGRLRLAGLLEGTSYLVLLYCSIVLKRIKGHEEAIHLPGAIHGGLFILLCVLLCLTKSAQAARPWTALCILASFCGMASKEVMLTAPLIALANTR